MKNVIMITLSLWLSSTTNAQIEVLQRIDQSYSELAEVSIEQRVENFLDARDNQPLSVQKALIRVKGEQLRSEGPGSLILMSDEVILKVQHKEKVIYLDYASDEAKANLLKPNLAHQAESADTFSMRYRGEDTLVLNLLFYTDGKSMLEYTLDTRNHTILALTEYSLQPTNYKDRDKIFPKRTVTATKFDRDPDLSDRGFDLSQIIAFDAHGNIVGIDDYADYRVLNPHNVQPQI